MTQLDYIRLLGAMCHDATQESMANGGHIAPVVFEREITDRELFIDAMRSSRDLVDWVQPCVTNNLFAAINKELGL